MEINIVNADYTRFEIKRNIEIFILYLNNFSHRWSVYREVPLFNSPRFRDKDVHKVLCNSFFFSDIEIKEIERFILINCIILALFLECIKGSYTWKLPSALQGIRVFLNHFYLRGICTPRPTWSCTESSYLYISLFYSPQLYGHKAFLYPCFLTTTYASPTLELHREFLLLHL